MHTSVKYTWLAIAAIALVTTAFSIHHQHQPTGTAATPPPAVKARSSFIEVAPNVKLHVTDWGTGTPVVLIHGYPLSDASWEYQYHALLKAGYRVIGITLRGFGESDKPDGRYDYDQFASDIKFVLDKLNIQGAILGGHSMGGAISIRYVARYNGAHLKKLVLFNAAAPRHTKTADYPYPFFTKETINAWLEVHNKNRPAFYDIIGARFTLGNTLTPGIGAWLGSIENQASPYATEQALKALRDEDLRADLAKVSLPTLILHSRRDSIVAFPLAEQMKAGIRNSTLIPFEKSGHAAFLEELDKTNTELLRFIQQ